MDTLSLLGSCKDWLATAAKRLPGRTTAAVRNRWVRLSKQGDVTNSLRDRSSSECQSSQSRPTWTRAEDAAILDSVAEHGKQWQVIAQVMPGRSVTALRNRYKRLSQASASHGSWSREEDAAIVSGVAELGNRWAMVAQRLPGRTEDAVRNRYKRLQRVQAVDQPAPADPAEAAGGASPRMTVVAMPAAALGGAPPRVTVNAEPASAGGAAAAQGVVAAAEVVCHRRLEVEMIWSRERGLSSEI